MDTEDDEAVLDARGGASVPVDAVDTIVKICKISLPYLWHRSR